MSLGLGLKLSRKQIRKVRTMVYASVILTLILGMSVCLWIGADLLQQAFFPPTWGLGSDPWVLTSKGIAWSAAGVTMFLSVFVLAGLE